MSCIVIVLNLLGFFNNMTALVAVNFYVISFEFGLGPIPWLACSEMFDGKLACASAVITLVSTSSIHLNIFLNHPMPTGKYVATAMSVSSQLNWACNFIVGLVFPYMNSYLGPYTFLPFAVVLLATFLFAAFVLPETQGQTPEQLTAEMTQTLSKTIVYQPNVESAKQIDMEWQKAMEQLEHEEEMEKQHGTYDYG